MCGLVGIAGALQTPDEDILKFLLMADYFRGQDATGVAAIRSNGDPMIVKLNVSPPELMHLAQFKTAVNGYSSKAFIGHNRAATRGKNVGINAHPFNFGHITGAHNGTLTSGTHTALEKALDCKYEVDSMALFAAIEKFGIEDTIKMCTEGSTEREGAWALSWYDAEQQAMFFLRNQHRPLYYSYLTYREEKTYRRLIWASEWWMIREAITAVKVKYGLYTEQVKDQTIGFFQFEPDVLYKFPLEALCSAGETIPKPIVKAKVKGEAAKEYRSANPTWPGPNGTTKPAGGNGTASQTSKTTTSTTSRGTTSAKRITADAPRLIQLSGSEDDPYASLVDEEKFQSICHRNVCCYCSKPILFGDPGITIIEREGQVMCRSCSGYDDSVVNPPTKLYIRKNIVEQLRG